LKVDTTTKIIEALEVENDGFRPKTDEDLDKIVTGLETKSGFSLFNSK